MKKRFLSMALIAGLILSMAGCGGNAETAITTKSGEVTTTTVATTTTAKAETAETTTAADTEDNTSETSETTSATTTTVATMTAVEEIKPPVEEQKVTLVAQYYDSNSMLFSTKDYRQYIYNMDDNTLLEYTDEGAIQFVDGNFAEVQHPDSYYNRLYNFKTKEFYDVTISYINAEYTPVILIEESFDGNVYKFGVLDKNGEWAMPLSTDNPISEGYKNEEGFFVPYASSLLVRLGYDRLYDWKNDKVINTNELSIPEPNLPTKTYSSEYPYRLSSITIQSIYDDSALLCVEYSASAMDGEYYSYVKYNVGTGEFTILSEGYDFEMINIGYDRYSLANPFNGSVVDIIDRSFNKLAGYDLREYENVSFRADSDNTNVTEKYIIFRATNPDGVEYNIILDKDGNEVIEPFKDEYVGEIYGDYIKYDNAMLNCLTGETVEFEYQFIDYVRQIDKYLVRVDKAYYFIDMSDPDTLINPLNITE